MQDFSGVSRREQILDGNRAAAEVAYQYSDVAALYPITPSSPMGEAVESFSARGRKNYAGQTVRALTMQSEGGAAGLLHGALSAGSLATTFTSSQGLLLMLPTLYKLAGEGLPAVIYVAARAVASHALSIFGDHSDVYAMRSAGSALLCFSSVQEVADLAPIAHLAALRGRLPVVAFFDGFRTSHELCKAEVWTPEALDALLDREAVEQFRQTALSPSHPVMRGTAENGDLFFQHREAVNRKYSAFPDIVERAMEQINRMIGSDYRCFSYFGSPNAERVIVAMGSVAGTVRELLDSLAETDRQLWAQVGFLQVRLYHPFDRERFLAALPSSCRKIAVLDRAKEAGAVGEPLYLEVSAALSEGGRGEISVIGGRYGLASKDTAPADILAVYRHLERENPASPFTLGITDDVTHLSLAPIPAPAQSDFVLRAYGIGGDGTVSALKNAAKLLGERYFVQAYFEYDSKKTGSITTGHLRISEQPILGSYLPRDADVILCGNLGLLRSDFPIADRLGQGGSLLIATDRSPEEVAETFPDFVKARLSRRGINVYLLPMAALREKSRIGKRTGSAVVAAFFAAGIGPAQTDSTKSSLPTPLLAPEEAMQGLIRQASRAYASKGEDAVRATADAVEEIFRTPLRRLILPSEWKAFSEDAPEDAPKEPAKSVGFPDGDAAWRQNKRGGWDEDTYLRTLLRPVSRMRGNEVPVSALLPYAEGSLPTGTSAFEKRGIAELVSNWHPERCIGCGRCSFVCPHAAIRAALLSEAELAASPVEIPVNSRAGGEGMFYHIAISPADCTGCTLCTRICPVSALSMEPREQQEGGQARFDYIYHHVSEKDPPARWDSVRGIQFSRPLQEFSGACAGCAQASYARLVTQLFGRRMVISNATGCSSIWGGSAPVSPYAVHPEGGGPAWANSLFEDNAEHGLGIAEGMAALRQAQAERLRELLPMTEGDLRQAIGDYFATYSDGRANRRAANRLRAELESVKNQPRNLYKTDKNFSSKIDAILANKNQLEKPSVWLFGGDGWAYDIGFGGLIHVLSGGSDVNVLVFDTEVYSNTGGQSSGSSRMGQVSRFAESGKRSGKKNLAALAMTLGNVYVGQIAMGADQNQTIRTLVEAEAYAGPSLVIAYSPCELHGVTGGLGEGHRQMERAVRAGYLTLFRYHPKEGFTVDSAEPDFDALRAFLASENRFARLERERPDEAEEILRASVESIRVDRERLLALGEALSRKQSE